MLKKYDLVVCSGGDGTLDEVSDRHGAKRGKCTDRIGSLRAVHQLTLQTLSAYQKIWRRPACRVAVNGTPFPCDVGGFNGDTFVYVAA